MFGCFRSFVRILPNGVFLRAHFSSDASRLFLHVSADRPDGRRRRLKDALPIFVIVSFITAMRTYKPKDNNSTCHDIIIIITNYNSIIPQLSFIGYGNK